MKYHISVNRKHCLTFKEAIRVAEKRVNDDELYLIRRHGGWFRPNAHGYTNTYAEAGIFDAKTAKRYLPVEGLSIVALSDVRDDLLNELNSLEDQIIMLKATMQKFHIGENYCGN